MYTSYDLHTLSPIDTQTNMNYPFDNAQPLTQQSQQQSQPQTQQLQYTQPQTQQLQYTQPQTQQHPMCVIHPHQINHEGNVLVQVHTHQNNGQPQTQSYYVSNADLPAFVQQHKQQFPTMLFTKQEQPNASTHTGTHPPSLTHDHASTLSTFAPYDKFDSTYSPCTETVAPRDDNC